MLNLSENLRQVMRHWTAGVTIVSSKYADSIHGMTVNSFTSISLDPPIVSVTLANSTRTLEMVKKSGIFTVSILSENQAALSDRFAGKISEEGNRFSGVEIFTMKSGAPLISNSLAYLDCNVMSTHELPNSTLILGAVIAAKTDGTGLPLIYMNRTYHSLK
jgi:flavin reductase (DIM6/NTAB) family NADH-FMN oxidoreductase RutF